MAVLSFCFVCLFRQFASNCIEHFETNEQYMERMGLGDYHKKKQTLLRRKKAFDCCFCDLVFSSKNLYHEHIQTVHEQTVTGNRRFIMCACSECGKLFHNKSNLSRHMENTHRQTDEIFTCDLCDQQCKSSKSSNNSIHFIHIL